jgi:hypothetical protein
MFDLIEATFLSIYGPHMTDSKRDLYAKVFRIFAVRDYTWMSSGVRWPDGTYCVSFEIHEVMWRLYRAIERGVSVSDVVETEIPEWTSNWYERIPGMFKRYGKGEDNGQAKIFYSVMLALSGLRDQKDLHIFVPGSGRMTQGWSYSAAAELLTQHGCSGRFELWDLLAEESNGQIGNFTMDYHKGYVPPIPETATHVLDDTYPCVLEPRQVKKAVERGVVVTAKIVLTSPAYGMLMRDRIPSRIFSQPFYSGYEKRIVYNYRPPKVTAPPVGCSCPSCLKRQEHYIGEEGEHHVFGMGVVPCYSLPGYNLLKECYPFRAGHVQDQTLALARMAPNVLKRYQQYGVMREHSYKVYSGIEQRHVVTKFEISKKNKKKKKNVSTMKPVVELHGFLHTPKGMVGRRIFLDDFPFVFYDKAWEPLVQGAYPRVVCEPIGVGTKAFVPEVKQPRAERLNSSKDDMHDLLSRVVAMENGENLEEDYKVNITSEREPWKVLYVIFGRVKTDHVRVGKRRYVLTHRETFPNLAAWKAHVFNQPLFHLNPCHESKVHVFSLGMRWRPRREGAET